MGLLVFLVATIGVIVALTYLSEKRKRAGEARLQAELEAIEKDLDAHGLPTVEPPISLQRGEVCHWAGPCSWHEMRSRTTRVSYRGAGYSIRIAKGLRYRVGSYSPRYERSNELTKIDEGELYVTSKRLFFDGRGKNSSLSYDKIVHVTRMLDAVMIDQSQGKDPYLKVGREQAARVAAIVARARSETDVGLGRRRPQMFAHACEEAWKFTRPVGVCSDCVDGLCRTGVGSFVVVNPEGWILTARHMKTGMDAMAASAGT